MNDNNMESKLGYSPLGSIKPAPSLKIAMYVIAALLLISGVIAYFAIVPEILVIVIFVLFALISWLCGLAFSRSAWYWNDKQLSITQLSGEIQSYDFYDIEKIYTVSEYPANIVIFLMKNGEEPGISLGADGAKELLEQIFAVRPELK